MGSLPAAHTGVGSATNGTFLQLGGALGVAVIGSLLNTRYQDTITNALTPYHVPHAVMQAILGSVGGALEVASALAASSARSSATWPAPPSPAGWTWA